MTGGSDVHANYVRAYYISATEYANEETCARPWAAIDVRDRSTFTGFNVFVYAADGNGIGAFDGASVSLSGGAVRELRTVCAREQPTSLHAGADGYIIASDVELRGAGCGIFALSTSGGNLDMIRGSISWMLTAAVCWDSGPYSKSDVLHDVDLTANAAEFAVVYDPTLPPGSALPTPTPVCTTDDCLN